MFCIRSLQVFKTWGLLALPFLVTLLGNTTNAQQDAPRYLRCFPDAENPSSDSWNCVEVGPDGTTTSQPSTMQAPLSAFDFVPRAFLSPEQRRALPAGCNGMYLDPLAGQSDPSRNLDEIPLVIEADESSMTGGNNAVLQGNVQVSHGVRSIVAEKMSYDRDQQQAALEGGVTIRNPGLLIRGDKAKASTIQNQATFEHAIFIMHDRHMRGSAESISQASDKVVILKNGKVTSCEPGDSAWSMEGGEIIIDNEKHQGTGRNLKLKIGPVPVAYLPYISFPLGDERKSGVLFPSISSSDDGGLDIAVPYYLNLAPNYDATLTPRLISGRGAMLEAEGRHLNRWLETTLNLAFLPNDEGGQDRDLDELIDSGILDEDQAKPYRGNDRWLASFYQVGGAMGYHGLYTLTNYTRVSDVDYFRDLGTSSFSSINTTYLDQYFELGYLLDNWQINTKLQNNQVLLLDVDDPYRKLPQINANGNYTYDRFGIQLNNEYTNFDHAEQFLLNGSPIIIGQRLATDYRINWAARGAWGFFVPEAGYKSLFYNLDEAALISPERATPSLGAGQASLDTGLVFEHPGGPVVQTFEPRVYYLYRAYQDHSELYNITPDGQDVNFDTSIRTFSYEQLFRDSRFGGKDRLDDANRATLGITSRWIDQRSQRELFRVSLGQVFLEDDQLVTLTDDPEADQKSEIAGELAADLGIFGQFYAAGIYDSDADQINRASAGISFADNSYNTLVNLSYTYVRNFQQVNTDSKDIDQVDLSAVFPLSKQWALMARHNYDFSVEQELETFLGLEYNDCCYRVRILARKWLDSNIATLVDDNDLQYDYGVFFEVHFKGLGGSGAKVTSILSDSIQGYQQRENLNFDQQY